jgi:hypothetical protein
MEQSAAAAPVRRVGQRSLDLTAGVTGKITSLQSAQTYPNGFPSGDAAIYFALDSQPGQTFYFSMMADINSNDGFSDQPYRTAMFQLLRDAYLNNLTVSVATGGEGGAVAAIALSH